MTKQINDQIFSHQSFFSFFDFYESFGNLRMATAEYGDRQLAADIYQFPTTLRKIETLHKYLQTAWEASNLLDTNIVIKNIFCLLKAII